MDDLFNQIEADKLCDAKDSLEVIFSYKVADAIDAMRQEIASKLTKECMDESKMGKKMIKMFTDLKKEPHGKVKSKYAHLSDEEFKKTKDDMYSGHGKVGEDLEENNTPTHYQDRMYVSDEPAPKNSNTVGKSKKEIRFGKVMDLLFKHAAKNTEDSKKRHAGENPIADIKKCCEDEEIK